MPSSPPSSRFDAIAPSVGVGLAAETPAPAAHIYIVDALRGFAALSVCFMHLTGGMLPKLVNSLTYPYFKWGGQGVTVFFVISGFVIPYVLIRRKYTLSQFGRFIGKRFVRIDPPSYISMGLTLLQWATIDLLFRSSHRWFVNITGSRLLHNFLYTASFTGDQEIWINKVFWTLAVEYQYYFTIALLFPLLLLNRYWLVAVSALLCLLPYVLRPLIVQRWGSLYDSYFFTQHVPVFWMGVLTAFSFERRLPMSWYLTGLVVLTGLAFHQTLLRYSVGAHPDRVAPFLYPAFAVVTALLIRFVSFKSGLTTFLGAISYSLYLTHNVAGTSTEVVVMKLLAPASDAARVLGQVICLGAVVSFAYLFYRYAEQPFVRLAGQMFKR